MSACSPKPPTHVLLTSIWHSHWHSMRVCEMRNFVSLGGKIVTMMQAASARQSKVMPIPRALIESVSLISCSNVLSIVCLSMAALTAPAQNLSSRCLE